MDLKLITNNYHNEGSEAVSFSRFVEGLIKENYLENKDILRELDDKLDELERRLIFENESVFHMVIETQGIGNKLVKLSANEIVKKYSLDSLSAERKKVTLFKREKFFIKYILQLLLIVLFSKFGNKKFYEYELLLELFSQERADFIALIAERNNISPLIFDRKHFIFYSSSFTIGDPNIKDDKIVVHTTERKIEISVSTQVYESYTAIKSISNYKWMPFSIMLISALQQAFEEIKTDDGIESIEDIENSYQWFMSVESRYEKAFSRKLTYGDFIDMQSFDLAQELLDKPNGKAIHNSFALITEGGNLDD